MVGYGRVVCVCFYLVLGSDVGPLKGAVHPQLGQAKAQVVLHPGDREPPPPDVSQPIVGEIPAQTTVQGGNFERGGEFTCEVGRVVSGPESPARIAHSKVSPRRGSQGLGTWLKMLRNVRGGSSLKKRKKEKNERAFYLLGNFDLVHEALPHRVGLVCFPLTVSMVLDWLARPLFCVSVCECVSV